MKKNLKLSILFALIPLIASISLVQLNKQNAKKKTVQDIYNNYVTITDDAGNEITEQFKKKYEQAYQEGQYSLIYEALEDVVYTKIQDHNGNYVPIS